MKIKFLFPFVLSLIFFNSCIQPGVKVQIKLSPPPPDSGKPLPQAAPGADLKDVGSLVGYTVTTNGKVCGHKDADNMIIVYLGAAQPNQQLTVILKGDAMAAFRNMDGKTVFVTGELSKHRGKPQMIIDDKINFGLKPQFVKPAAD